MHGQLSFVVVVVGVNKGEKRSECQSRFNVNQFLSESMCYYLFMPIIRTP